MVVVVERWLLFKDVRLLAQVRLYLRRPLVILAADSKDLPVPVDDAVVGPETGSRVVGTRVAKSIQSIARLVIGQVDSGLKCFCH
jgi:hypothetical protein